MMSKVKSIIIISLVSFIILGFSVFGLVKPDEKYSNSERRTLSSMPKLSVENLASGRFMTDFEDYTLDQFPFRDAFRKIKTITSLYLFRQKTVHDLYIVDGYLSKLEYPENFDRINNSISKLQSVYDDFIKGSDCKTYLSVIPDKNYFLAPLGNYPIMDYDSVLSTIKDKMDFAEYIDIFDKLELSDYYFTDQHWRQEKIVDVAETLVNAMGGDFKGEFTENSLDTPLYGAYVGQSALNFKGDKVVYLTNDALESSVVTSYSTGNPLESQLYNFKKADGKDVYEFFLSGSEPFLTIENPKADTDKELVIFRDSFSSSLAPLLVSSYSKITLIDLRYMKSDLIGEFMKFDNQDVIFLYSTLIFNNSISM